MRLYIPLTRTEFDRLRDLALIERRRPQDQAAMLLAQALWSEPSESSGESKINATISREKEDACDSAARGGIEAASAVA